MTLNTIFFYAIGLALLYVIGMLLVLPLKKILKLIINGIVGGITLLIFNFVGGFFGLGIIINPLNAIIVGLLGVPGVVLILILQRVL